MSALTDVAAGLRGLDLDLLLYLDALLRLRGVGRAADEVGITQSAMSHALKRLRTRFGDPLLVRVGAKMAPTPFAERLHPPLRAALVDLHRALSAPHGFEPATATRTFRIATPDLFDALLLPAIADRLASAPAVSLSVQPYGRAPLGELLASGALDLAIVPVPEGGLPHSDGALVVKTLFRDSFRCFLRAATAPARWDLETWLSLRHVLVSPEGRGQGVVDAALAAAGHRRHVALRLPTFAAAPAVIAQTDMVLTAPASMAQLTAPLGIVDRPPPIPLPGHGIAMLWHRRFGRDPGLLWLQAQISAAVPQSDRRTGASSMPQAIR